MSIPHVGHFVDVVGLEYATSTQKGETSSSGEFRYLNQEQVSFSIGPLSIGTATASTSISIIDLVPKGDRLLTNPRLLNVARLLFSLSPGLGFEKPILIDEKVRKIISKYAGALDLDCSDPVDLDGVLSKISLELNIPVKTIAHVRNHLALAGFKVLRDLHIPTRDGAFVFADLYLPLDGLQKYPVLLSSTVYGKRVVYSGPNLDDPAEIAAFEKAEDDWHSTTADKALHVPNTGPWFHTWLPQRRFETIATFNTFAYVPRGYAMIKTDPRGISQTPGIRAIPGQEAKDLFDAVEWSTVQKWCTGNVALAGNSYGANVQWPVAQMKPKGLKAFIPYAGDVDRYREVNYIGGLPVHNYISQWLEGVRAASHRWKDATDIMRHIRSMPFYNETWQKGAVTLEDIDLPCFLAASQLLIVHNRGSYEAWRRMSSKDKHLQIVDSNYYGWPNHQVVDKIVAFLDRHLKGLTNVKLEPVGLQMRIGGGLWYWRTEEDWPIPDTQYLTWYLNQDGTLRHSADRGPVRQFSYSATAEPSESAGVTFLSALFPADVELAGHFIATLFVSSSIHDADVVVQLWAVDSNDQVVLFGTKDSPEPMAFGILRASHRKLDPGKSLPWRPWHTHTKEDHAPLNSGEVVHLEVEIFPATARIRAGWRLRVDIGPSEEQPNIPGFQPPQMREWQTEIHPSGAINTVHVGGDYVSSITLPVVPLKPIGQIGIVSKYDAITHARI